MTEIMIFVWIIGFMYTVGRIWMPDSYGWVTLVTAIVLCIFIWPFFLGVDE